jgi:phosphatidylglycerophosphate synthase
VVVGAAQPDRLRATLAAAGAPDAVWLGAVSLAGGLRAVAEVLSHGAPVVVLESSTVLPVAAVARLVDDPSVGTGVLVARDLRTTFPVRTLHGIVASAGSDHHEVSEPDTGSLGAVVVQASDAATAALAEMATVAAAREWSGSVTDHLLVALVRREVAVRAVASPLPATRSDDADARAVVAQALDAGADAQALKDSGNRVDDGLYSTFVLRKLSKPVTELALRLGLSPNQVSLLSFAIGLTAAALFAVGGEPAMLVAALLLQLSLVVDCVDGEVARRTRRFSALGAWLDASTDRVKEYAVYGALAVAAGGGRTSWLLAGVVLVLQTVRHMGDYVFARVQRVRETWVRPRPLEDPSDGGLVSHGAALDASRRASGVPGVRWVKKVVHMPIGERWLVISVVSVAVGPRAVLVALLALGLVAAAYTTAGRLLRVRSWDGPTERSGREVLVPQLDTVTALAPRLDGRLGWAAPAVLRLVELALVLLLTRAVAPDELPWAYALCFVLAFHHYDALYRALGGSAPPAWLVRGGLGVEGRLLVLVVAAILGASVLTAVLVGGTLLLAAWFVVVASVQFVQGLQSGREVAA